MQTALLRRSALIIAATVALVSFSTTVQGAKGLTEEQSWAVLKTYLMRYSARTYRKLMNSRAFERVDSPADAKMLREMAHEISRGMGKGDYAHPVKIVRFRRNPNMVNAFTLPGGQIFFLTGILDILKARAGKMAAEKTALNKKLGAKAVDHHYRRLLAAVLGHEMGHYFGQHFMRRYVLKVKSLNNSGKSATIPVEQIRYNQEHEYESDEFGLRALRVLGYKPRYLVEVLKVLKGERDRYIKAGRIKPNPFLESHPTGNARLAAISKKSKDKNFYEKMARLERAFASIETGTELDQAAETLDAELKRFPKNPHLLAAAAKVYHRRWESSCSIDELMFKVSLAPVSFQDAMVPQKPNLLGSAPGPAKIPGDQRLHAQARTYYSRAIKVSADLMTQSSYAALLAYDPSPAAKQRALAMAELPLKRLNRRQWVERTMALNNAGIVYHLTGDNHSSEEAFRSAAGVLLKGLKGRPSFHVRKTRKKQLIMQAFSGRNVGRLFEAQFNLAQLYQRTGYPKAARTLWTAYIKKLDWRSEWARYAAGQIGLNLARLRPGPPPQVAGVPAGASIPTIVSRLGKPQKERTYMNYTVWYFQGGRVVAYILTGFAKRIVIQGKGSPEVSNGMRVAMTRSAVERKFGKPPMVYGHRVVYPRRYMMVTYSGDRVNRIMLYR